jgi:hypothetical protein
MLSSPTTTTARTIGAVSLTVMDLCSMKKSCGPKASSSSKASQVLQNPDSTDPTETIDNRDPTGTIDNRDPTGTIDSTDPTGTIDNRDPTGTIDNRDPTGTIDSTDPTGTIDNRGRRRTRIDNRGRRRTRQPPQQARAAHNLDHHAMPALRGVDTGFRHEHEGPSALHSEGPVQPRPALTLTCDMGVQPSWPKVP